MNKLIEELQRLYFLPGAATPAPEAIVRTLAGEAGASFGLMDAEGRVRTLAIRFERSADWKAVAGLCEGVQADLDLPAPAISVSARGGYQVWFSLAEPVAIEQARGFLNALRRRYLAEIPDARLRLLPDPEAAEVALVPAFDTATDKWSAFIDPNLGSMFADEPGLDMAPNPDKQADLLAGFESIKAADFQRALGLLLTPAAAEAVPGEGAVAATLAVGGHFSDPKSFLLAVMNDVSASPALRVEAAKALLPYFEPEGRK